MINDSDYLDFARAQAREYSLKVTIYPKYIDSEGKIAFGDGVEYASYDSLFSLKITKGKTYGGIQLGQAFCPSCTFSLRQNNAAKTGDKVKVTIHPKNYSGSLTLATVYVDQAEHTMHESTYTAYGKMLQLDKPYVSALSFPAKFSQVVEEIAEMANVTNGIIDMNCDFTFPKLPIKGNNDDGSAQYYTMREIVGYIAALNAANAVIDDDDEKLTFVKFRSTNTEISYSDCFSRTVSNEAYVISKINVDSSGTTTGEADGSLNVYFPLELEEPKETWGDYATSELVGTSIMGARLEWASGGFYELGDVLAYDDFDGNRYDFAVMGIQYDFSSGFFVETLFSLAPSEMEAAYAGNIIHTATQNNISNPVILAEKGKSYLNYSYTTVGYVKGDEITYGETSNRIVCQGYVFSESGTLSISGDTHYKRATFEHAFLDVTTPEFITDFVIEMLLVSSDSNHKTYQLHVRYTLADGEVVEFYNTDTAKYDYAFILSHTRVNAPNELAPYGYISFSIARGIERNSENWDTLGAYWNRAGVAIPFANIAEYNAAVNLTNSPLITYDVNQKVLQITEANQVADLPEIGDNDVLYVTYQPPAVYKYSTVARNYYCVGRDYKEIQRIVSTTKPDDNEVATYKVPVVFDVRTKAEWELEANTVFPKGFVIFEQEPETREKTKIKIANGIDKLSDLLYNGIDEDIIDGKADKSDFQNHVDDKHNPHAVTAEQIGLGNVENKSADEILSGLQIGGTNLIYDSGFTQDIFGKALFESTFSVENYDYSGAQWAGLSRSGYTGTARAYVTRNLSESAEAIPYKAGDSFVLTAMIYAEGLTNDNSAVIFQGETTAERFLTLNLPMSAANGEWTRYEVKFMAAQDGVFKSFYIALGGNGTLKVARLKLEKGGKATDWSAAPEDVLSLAKRVAALEATILALGGET